MNHDFSEEAEFYEKHLRPFSVEPERETGNIPFFGSLPDLFTSFRQVTGVDLTFVRHGGKRPESRQAFEIPVGKTHSPGSLWLVPETSAEKKVVASARKLAESIAQTLAETWWWSESLRNREVELAVAGIIRSERGGSERALSRRLTSILKNAAKTAGFEASSLYLLDEETTILKLRSLWGLPVERLTDPPRKLAAAMADLEAFLGNAVVLNESYLLDEWNAPEYFPMSVCVPVASDQSILGTLWLFSDEKRDLTQRDLTILDLAAGQIASELERAGLQRENDSLRAEIERIRVKRRKRCRRKEGLTRSPHERPETGDFTRKEISPKPALTHSTPNFQTLRPEEIADHFFQTVFKTRSVPKPTVPSSGPLPSPTESPEFRHLEEITAREAKDLLQILAKNLEKKGDCKNLTLFVVRNPPLEK